MQNITIEPVGQNITDFLALEPGMNKRYQYYQNIADRSFTDASLIIKDDGVIHYAYSVYKIKRSKDGYYRHKTKRQGFTYENGKLEVWFGGNINSIPNIIDVLKHLNKEWFTSDLTGILTKGLLQKVLNGKITNPFDYAKAYIKQMRINCSPKLVLEVVQKHNKNSAQIHRAAQVAKDLNHYFEFVIDQSDKNYPEAMPIDILLDLEKQAMILDKKIDYRWSKKRMEDEHIQWTKEIMELEIGSLSDEPLDWIQPMHDMIPNEHFTLLDTQKKVFTEGKMMMHCVYTNYWKSVKDGRYAAFHIEFFGEKATLGLNIYREKILFNQMYGKRNQAVSNDFTVYVKNWIADLNKRDAAKQLTHEHQSLVHEFDLVDLPY